MPGWIRQTRDLLEETPVGEHKEGAGRAVRSQCRSDLSE